MKSSEVLLPDEPSGCLFQSNWIGISVAFTLVLVAVVYIPPIYPALNFFEVPKRMLWSVLAVFLSAVSFSSRRSSPEGIGLALPICILWILGRSLVRENPAVELEVLATWVLPGVLFGAGLAVGQKSIRPVALALLLVGFVEGVLMCLQYIGQDPLFYETTEAFTRLSHRMIGSVGNKNQAADVVSLSCAAVYVLIRKPFFRLLILGVLLLVVSLTSCRGAMVGLVGAVFTVEGFQIWRRGDTFRNRFLSGVMIASILFSIMLGTVVLVPQTRERVMELISSPCNNRTVSFRGTMASIATKMWAEKPVAGWGAGAFAFQYLDRLKEEMPDVMSRENLSRLKFVREAHNEYLQFAAEFGVIGILLSGGLLVCILRAVWRGRLTEPAESMCCLFLLVYLALKSLVSFPIQSSMAGPMAFLLLGLILPRSRKELGKPPTASFYFNGWFCLVLAVGLLLWNVMEVRCNTLVPLRIRQGKVMAVAEEVPGYMYKYHAVIGGELAQSDQLAAAERELRHAHIGYSNPAMYHNLSYVYARLGRWGDTVTVCQNWVDSGLEYGRALKLLSAAHEQAGSLEQAGRVGEQWLRFVCCDDETRVQRVIRLSRPGGRA